MKLFRISSILSLLMAALFGVLLFWTSQAVQHKESELKEIREKLAQEEETLRVLGVEWDYLNRPQRLEKLAAEQLGMELPSAQEMVRAASEIPEPIIVNTDPAYFTEGEAQPVSLDTAPAKPQTQPKETVSPSKAEKQSFDRLIQSLDAEGSAAQ